MDPLELMITSGGMAALVNAQNGSTERIKIVSVGLTQNPFIMAPTLTALPGEIKRVESVSGEATSASVIHMTMQDVSSDIYDLRGIGLYLEDGTLFAVYSQADPIFTKVSVAFFLLALDIAFANGAAGDIIFGDTSFLMPPASETTKGVAEIATPDEAATGTDHSRIITPLTLKQIIDAFGLTVDADLTALADGFDALLSALVARTITGSGLVTGGGDLTASRVLSVAAASAGEVAAGAAADRAVTPAALSGLMRLLAQNGYAMVPGCGGLIVQWGRFTAAANTTTTTLFPIAFPTECFSVAMAGGHPSGVDSQDNPPVLVTSGIERSGFAVFSADDSADGCAYIAVGA